MNYPKEEIDSLKDVCPNLSTIQEGGYTFFYIKDLRLPNDCRPQTVDALLCPSLIQGYESRLYFSSKIQGTKASRMNWNGNIRTIGKNWFAISWRTSQKLTLVEKLITHLNALK